MDADLERRVAALEERLNAMREREAQDKKAIPRIIFGWTVVTIALMVIVKAYWP